MMNADIENAKGITEIIEAGVKTFGILVGAVWVYFKFIRTRENHPKIEFNVSLSLVGRQDKKILLEIAADLENKGLVRHWINDFSCDVLTLRSGAPVIHGDERINYQLLFDKHNPSNVPVTDDNPKGRIIWIPKDWYESYIDPGIKQRYTYLTDVPEDTAFVSIYSQFYYKKKRKMDFQTAQRTFSIDALEEADQH